MYRIYRLSIVLLSLIAMVVMIKRGEAQPTVKLDIDPDVRSLTIGADPKEIVITTRTSRQNLQFTWRLDGPGKLVGDVTSPGILYIVPDRIEGASAETIITVTVIDDQGRKATESVTFTLISDHQALTPTTALTTEKTMLFRDSVSGMEIVFVKVPGGSYEMGCGSWADGCGSDEKLHTEQVAEFWIGQYEVTRKQWRQVLESGSQISSQDDDNLPIDNISWVDVQAFLEKLTANNQNYVFRLPTEAEWEYACRSGGRPENYSGGDDLEAVAWYKNNSDRKIHPVGEKQPNGLGIYDMSGNVREWTLDWYAADYSYPSTGTIKVARGGGWVSAARYVRCTNREQYLPDIPKVGLGFRIVIKKNSK